MNSSILPNDVAPDSQLDTSICPCCALCTGAHQLNREPLGAGRCCNIPEHLSGDWLVIRCGRRLMARGSITNCDTSGSERFSIIWRSRALILTYAYGSFFHPARITSMADSRCSKHFGIRYYPAKSAQVWRGNLVEWQVRAYSGSPRANMGSTWLD